MRRREDKSLREGNSTGSCKGHDYGTGQGGGVGRRVRDPGRGQEPRCVRLQLYKGIWGTGVWDGARAYSSE